MGESAGIFGGYDVRGVYGENFSDRDALDLGKAFGTFLLSDLRREKPSRYPKIALGRDNRLSSPALRKAFVEGFISTGCSIVDVGIVPSPVVYFACWALRADGAVVITASHNPAKYNGIKMLKGIWPLSSRELLEVKEIFSSKKFTLKPKIASGRVFEKEVLGDYLRFVAAKNLPLGGMRGVIDGGNRNPGGGGEGHGG